MHPYKAAGLDDMSTGFFQHFWNVIGGDMIDFCLNFLNHGVLPPNINKTTIVLIPKVGSPESMSRLRPIRLCNAVYKIISEAIAN